MSDSTHNSGTLRDTLIAALSSRYFYLFTLAWFIVQAAVIALITEFAVPPDENFHFNLIQLYAERSYTPFLDDQEGYYWLGDVTRQGSILFHYILSWPYRLLDALPATYVYLRFINIGFAVGTLLLIKRLANRLGFSDFVANLSLFMLVNTLMFVFLSAAISYDNPLILLSFLSLVLLVSIMQNFRTVPFLSLVLVMSIASVVKFTFLPLALFITAALFMYYRKSIGGKARLVWKDVRANLLRKQMLVLIPLLLISLVFAFERYGTNLIEYNSVKVGCAEIHSREDCRQSPLFRRGERVEAKDREPTLSTPGFSLRWAATTKERIYGIFAHESMTSPLIVSYGTWAVTGFMGIAFIRKYHWRGRSFDYLLLISIAYVTVVAGKNFTAYLDHGIFGMALQGRYIFPVFPLLYLAGNHYVEKLCTERRGMLLLYAGVVLGVFAVAGLPSYLFLAGSEWYTDSFQELFKAWAVL